MKKLLYIIMAGMIMYLAIDIASANYYDNFHWECGQEHFILQDETGYIYWEADAKWREKGDDLELYSMISRYNNGSQTITAHKGFTTPKFELITPLTCKQLTGFNFVGSFGIPEPEKEDKLVKENKELKKENEELKKNLLSLVEKAVRKTVQELLNNI